MCLCACSEVNYPITYFSFCHAFYAFFNIKPMRHEKVFINPGLPMHHRFMLYLFIKPQRKANYTGCRDDLGNPT